MLLCDINCDMGECIGNPACIMQSGTDGFIMPYITSANIACGNHAGDENTIRQTILLAQKYNVNIGAHPSFLDRENFGRTEIKLSPGEVYELVFQQIKFLKKIAKEYNATVTHVKPHGALYNMAARDRSLAQGIAQAVKDCNELLIVFGLSNSYLISEAHAIGLRTANEVFADRTYQDDGCLTPRSKPNALIHDVMQMKQQVLKMIRHGKVKTVSGNEIPVIAETICIHSDGEHAVEFAKELHAILQK